MFKNYKSPETFNLKTLEDKLQVMNSNILYITHEIDQVKKIVIELELNKRLQRQVDEYMDEGESHPGSAPEDST